MVRSQPIASDVEPTSNTSQASSAARTTGGVADLSPAQQRALDRCAPLNTAEFKALGDLADAGHLPLRRFLRRHRARGTRSD